eukprot:40843-Chlamydomonas_euryale.AAC.1
MPSSCGLLQWGVGVGVGVGAGEKSVGWGGQSARWDGESVGGGGSQKKLRAWGLRAWEEVGNRRAPSDPARCTFCAPSGEKGWDVEAIGADRGPDRGLRAPSGHDAVLCHVPFGVF